MRAHSGESFQIQTGIIEHGKDICRWKLSTNVRLFQILLPYAKLNC